MSNLQTNYRLKLDFHHESKTYRRLVVNPWNQTLLDNQSENMELPCRKS